MRRLAIVTTHPIQYYAPLFKLLAKRKNIDIKVFYTWGEKGNGKLFDPGFGQEREWDIPLLDGYEYQFMNNISSSPGSHKFNGINTPDLVQDIISWHADAVLVIGWKFKSHLHVMHYFKGKIPVLFRGDSTLLDEAKGFSFKKIIRRFSLFGIYRYVDYALYVGTNNKAYFSAIGLPPAKLKFAPHAIDNERFSEKDTEYEKQATEWKNKLNIPINKTTVLFAGKLEQKKNPLFLIEAAKKFPNIHFIIVGNGVLEEIIKVRSSTLKNITILPFQNQSKMPVVYRLGDIFALPSQGSGETWGLAINEAMASGRMVIASNKCGCAVDLIKDGINGFVINPEKEDLFKALSWIEKSPNKINSFKNNSKKIIKEFNLEKLSVCIENLVISK